MSTIAEDLRAVLTRLEGSSLLNAVVTATLGPEAESFATSFMGALSKLEEAHAADKAQAVKDAHDQGVTDGQAAPPSE